MSGGRNSELAEIYVNLSQFPKFPSYVFGNRPAELCAGVRYPTDPWANEVRGCPGSRSLRLRLFKQHIIHHDENPNPMSGNVGGSQSVLLINSIILAGGPEPRPRRFFRRDLARR
jgi:hypothetical protein